MRREVRATANRLANFDDANLRRSARAAVAAGSRVERAMEILGDDVPDHLKAAGMLRLEHKQASLEELGQLADPPMTRKAISFQPMKPGWLGRKSRAPSRATKNQAMTATGISRMSDPRAPSMVGAADRSVTFTIV